VSRAADPGFSFAACGDSRPMMYLPYKEGQPELYKLLLDPFDLVLPEKVAEEVLKRDVKLIFDPVTKDLIQTNRFRVDHASVSSGASDETESVRTESLCRMLRHQNAIHLSLRAA
jgi:hypothetical protein